jgi:hypothetical protein
MLFASAVEHPSLTDFVEEALLEYSVQYAAPWDFTPPLSIGEGLHQLQVKHPEYVRAALGRIDRVHGRLGHKELWDFAHDLEKQVKEMFIVAHELERNPQLWDSLETEPPRALPARAAA